MQVIEPGAQPPALQVPLAEIVGLQFGLATSKELLGFSVVKSRCDSLKNLVDPRLGLPAENEICATCGGTNYDECTGHFAHVKLTQPIFHPNHIRLLKRVLQSVCLACGALKEKKKKIPFIDEAASIWRRNTLYFEPEEGNGDRAPPVVVAAEPMEEDAANGVIDLSSDDEIPPDILQVIAHGATGIAEGSTSAGIKHLPSLRVARGKGKALANGSSKKSATAKSKATQSHVKSSKKIYKGRPAGLDVLDADNHRSSKKSACRHCSSGNPEYRPIVVKILPAKGRKIGDSAEVLQLEVVDDEDDVWLPDDFWSFLGGPARSQDNEFRVPTTHALSPSEAYTVLKKIPEGAISKLGMNRLVARPEGLIMKCVPVPPNCTRTTDYKYVNNTTAVQFGSDNVTRTLQNLVTEIARIQRTRTGKATSRAQREESAALQILTAQYLREKGAPKAVAGREPQKRDRNGRITKQDDHRWTKEWLSDTLLGKGGNFTAKAVIAGDPSLGIEEVGVPWAIAHKLTIPERATQWNCAKLQDYVDAKLQEFRILKELSPQKGRPGATRVERGGQAFQVMLESSQTHKVQIGDVVHRNIQDGDYVYVNRPPSVHKHSLMALKVLVHYGLVITVNPLVCPPFSADFDGDIFHLFVPQSLQVIAELEQLMSVPRQIVSDHGGQPLLGLTQDTLLAAHLLTTSKLFVDKASMHQLRLWSSKSAPEAAIVKSPKGCPLWTGEQVFALTLPETLNMGSADESMLIQGGEILKWPAETKLLRKESKSIASALCFQLGSEGLVDYLNNAAGLLHAWLQDQGFSTGLTDFQVTNNSAARQQMLQCIFEEYYMKSIEESCDSVRILDAKAHATGPDMIFNPETLTKNVRFLEQAAQQIFRSRESDVESILARYADKNNSLLLMVKSGSKGSRGKLLQQIAGMGLQLFKGKHLLPFSSSRRSCMSNSPVLDWWEDKGLVRSSLVDGLSASGLFNHVIADRTGILRKHVEVAQPGTLFKSLMLFLRDLRVVYDGSVRSQCGNHLVQFCYGGAVGVRRRTVSPSGPIPNRVGGDDPIAALEEAEGDLTWDEDDSRRWPLSVLAGEPVGVLAATAISQPAYELMLDAPSLNGPFMPRPLELVQETLYPREKSELKPSDRCVLIRLVKCLCTKPFCLERRVLEVQAFLTRITLKTLALSSAIQFWDVENFRLAGSTGESLRLGSPWLGHIKLSVDMMRQHQVDFEGILQRLREKFGDSVKNTKKQPMGQIFFCCSRSCTISNGCCLHFSPSLPRKMQNEKDSDLYNAALLILLMKIRRTIIPGLLDCTVKGDERLESVRIVSEGPTWTTSHNLLAFNRDVGEELVLELTVAPTKSKMKRSIAWASVKEACLPLMDMVDWNRSMPYSIQEIRHALGVETAYQMVVRRLGLVLENTAPHTNPVHVKLIADMMTFSGDANAFNISGFQDLNKITAVSAPFTEASFKKPVRTLLDAAGRGATDSLQGVMPSCVWGKEAPLGTGHGFDVFWQPSKDMQSFAMPRDAEKDVHAIWTDLDGKCIPDRVIPSSPAVSLPGPNIFPERDLGLDEGAGFSPQHTPNFQDADETWVSSRQDTNRDSGVEWGSPPEAGAEDGGWGNVGNQSGGNEVGGWGLDESTYGMKGQRGSQENEGWGSVSTEKAASGNAWEDKSEGNGGWGSVGNEKGTSGNAWEDKSEGNAGWGSLRTEKGTSGNAWEDKSEGNDGWGSVGNEKGTSGNAWEDRREGNDGWGSVGNEKGTSGNAWEDRREGNDGWGSVGNESDPPGNAWEDKIEDKGGWGSVGHENGKSGNTWDDEIAGDVQGGWREDPAATPCGGGNSEKAMPDQGIWGNNIDSNASRAVQVGGCAGGGGGVGWDTVSTEVAEGDGWDSFATPRTDSAQRRSPDHTDRRADSRAEADPSEGRPFSTRDEIRDGDRSWSAGGGRRGRGRGDHANSWAASSRSAYVSGANVVPLGVRRQVGSWQEPNVAEKNPRIESLSPTDKTVQASGWDDGPSTSTRTPAQRDGNWGEPKTDDANGFPQSSGPDPDADSGVDWSQLVSGSTQVDAWKSCSVSEGNEAAADGWDALPADVAGNGMGARHGVPDHKDSPSQERHFGGFGRGRGRGGRGNDWVPTRSTFRRQDVEPECKEIDDLVKSMGRILFNQKCDAGGRLSDKDDESVQSVLAYHPNFKEKVGCGVAYIKVDRSQDYPDVHCFWVVRTDGSGDEFSYHKCLKAKVLREFPSFTDRYDALYTRRGRGPPTPAANSVEGGQAGQWDVDAEACGNSVEGGQSGQRVVDAQAGGNSVEGQAGQRVVDAHAGGNLVEGGQAGQRVVYTQSDIESTRMSVVDTQASQSN